MRLGVLARVAIVASVAWIVGATIYFSIGEYAARRDAALGLEKICLDQAQYGPSAKFTNAIVRCYEEASKTIGDIPRLQTLQFGAIKAALLLAVGLVVYGLSILSFRWIVAGRARP